MSTTTKNPFVGIPCRDCGVAALSLVWRPALIARPLCTWSLAGVGDKTSAITGDWPWCVCGSCGAESRGKK